jgi:hypothetical protein
MRGSVLVVLFMAGMVGAAELTASLVDIKPLGGSNCRIQNGPVYYGSTYYDVSAIVENPSTNRSLRVSYMYYNSSSGEFEDGGKVCDVAMNAKQNCRFRVYTITGGKNATDVIPFKIIGWVGELCGENSYCVGSQEYETVLNVTVSHYTSIYEQNVLDKLNIANSEYERVSAQYTGDCYNTSGMSVLQNASSEMQNASYLLVVCDMHDSLYLANDAINKIREAERYAKPVCNATPPKQNNSQPPPPPPENNTTEIPPNETLNQTLSNVTNNTQNITDITSTLMKGCVPSYILATLLLAAVWSGRRQISA